MDTTILVITTFIEIVAVLLLIWGFANEEKFVAFEDKLFKAVVYHRRKKKYLKAIKNRISEHEAYNNAKIYDRREVI